MFGAGVSKLTWASSPSNSTANWVPGTRNISKAPAAVDSNWLNPRYWELVAVSTAITHTSASGFPVSSSMVPVILTAAWPWNEPKSWLPVEGEVNVDWLCVLTAGMGKAKLGAPITSTNWVSDGTSMEN